LVEQSPALVEQSPGNAGPIPARLAAGSISRPRNPPRRRQKRSLGSGTNVLDLVELGGAIQAQPLWFDNRFT